MTDEFRPDADRLAALAEFAAGAGHEINNPLATIIGRAQQLLREEVDPTRRQSLAAIVSQAYRIRDMIGDVMAFARPPAPHRSVVDLAHLVRDAVAGLETDLHNLRCRILVETPASLPIVGDAAQIAMVTAELIRNAATALQPQGGPISVTVSAGKASALLQVADAGCGFSEQQRAHAFDPFFSGRQAGRGLGFGLCKVWQVVCNHDGELVIDSSPGGPTTVTVHWPLPAEGQVGACPAPANAPHRL